MLQKGSAQLDLESAAALHNYIMHGGNLLEDAISSLMIVNEGAPQPEKYIPINKQILMGPRRPAPRAGFDPAIVGRQPSIVDSLYESERSQTKNVKRKESSEPIHERLYAEAIEKRRKQLPAPPPLPDLEKITAPSESVLKPTQASAAFQTRPKRKAEEVEEHTAVPEKLRELLNLQMERIVQLTKQASLQRKTLEEQAKHLSAIKKQTEEQRRVQGLFRRPPKKAEQIEKLREQNELLKAQIQELEQKRTELQALLLPPE